eukprot:TRINITY_DN2993_c0_g1_i8.p1 TRINITY_DN2993_c0_g1~~TRINITY_DN2993_c0_g1_i8.p1  ORF type:complete len:787 (-),score=172.62 TRINITY_DN2993_c0_g1_i8:970-3189(-)
MGKFLRVVRTIDSHIPLFFDAVSNGFRSKWWTMTMMLLIWTLIGDQIFTPFFRSIEYGSNKASSVAIVGNVPSVWVFDEPIDQPLIFRIQNDVEKSLQGKNVTIQVARFTRLSFDLDLLYQVDCTEPPSLDVYDYYKAICTGGVLSGSSNISNAFGFVSFDRLIIKSNFEGLYIFRATCDDFFAEFPVQVISVVGNLQIRSFKINGKDFNSSDILTLTPSDSFSVDVFVPDVTGSPRVGGIVHLIGNTFPSIFSVEGYLDPDGVYPRHVLMQNSQAVTDSNGIARFRDVSIYGSNTQFFYLSAISESGSVDLIQGAVNFASSLSVKVDGSFSNDVKEGEEMQVPPTIQVLDSNGNPMQGQLVYARIINWNDTYPLVLPIYGTAPRKVLPPISPSTDANGRTTFSGFRFERNGPAGIHEVVFVCNGFESDPIKIYVRSQVQQLVPIWAPDREFDTGSAISILPSFLIADEFGKGINGKEVKLEARGGAFRVYFEALPSDETGTVLVKKMFITGANIARGTYFIDASCEGVRAEIPIQLSGKGGVVECFFPNIKPLQPKVDFGVPFGVNTSFTNRYDKPADSYMVVSAGPRPDLSLALLFLNSTENGELNEVYSSSDGGCQYPISVLCVPGATRTTSVSLTAVDLFCNVKTSTTNVFINPINSIRVEKLADLNYRIVPLDRKLKQVTTHNFQVDASAHTHNTTNTKHTLFTYAVYINTTTQRNATKKRNDYPQRLSPRLVL